MGQKLLEVQVVRVSHRCPLHMEPVGGEDERVENVNQDDGEGRDKDKIDEGDMNNKETGVSGGLKASYTGILRSYTLIV